MSLHRIIQQVLCVIIIIAIAIIRMDVLVLATALQKYLWWLFVLYGNWQTHETHSADGNRKAV